jgi:hypothetical protein
MSKFSIKIKLQGLEIEVEGTQDSAPRLAQKVGEQIGALIKPSLLLEAGRNGGTIITDAPESGDDKGKTRKKKSGGSAKSSTEDVPFTHNPSTHGSPSQEWTTVQKAIWFLYAAAPAKPASGGSIAKAFNKQFRSAGAIVGSNVTAGLDKEKLKGSSAPVGAEVSDGTAARYYLTEAGKAMGAQLAQGITA